MRVLVTGGYGLIGSACLARLHRDGHELVAAGRAIEEARRRAPFARWIAADFNRLTQREDWAPLLAGIEAVVIPPRAPKANAYAERWGRTVRVDCLDWTLIWNRLHLHKVITRTSSTTTRADHTGASTLRCRYPRPHQ